MKINFDKENGIQIVATFKGSVEDYAMMWLNLTNNARENKEAFYNVENNCHNDIYVLTNEKDIGDVVDYLQRIGLEIIDKYPCVAVLPYVEYGSSDDEDWEFGKLREY